MEGRVFATNFPSSANITQEYVESLFIPFGPIVEVVMGKDFAEIQFESDEDALAAIENMDGSQVFGQTLKVRRAKKETASLDSTTPVWNQESYLQSTE